MVPGGIGQRTAGPMGVAEGMGAGSEVIVCVKIPLQIVTCEHWLLKTTVNNTLLGWSYNTISVVCIG